MEYSTIVDGEKFIFKEELFEKELKNLLLRYKYLSNNCFMSIIILDNKEVREYLKNRLKESINDLTSIDFNIESDFRQVGKVIKQDKVPLIIYNLEKYYEDYAIKNEEYLNYMIEYHSSEKFKEKCRNNKVDYARSILFFSINMSRDGIFFENKARFFMILSNEDYEKFVFDDGDDFASYCQYKPDFNTCFINKDNISLSEYYKEKQLSKIFKKEKKL